MHICYLAIESPISGQGGGISSYVRGLLPELVAAGHKVTVIANAPRVGNHLLYDGMVKIIHINLPPLHWYLAKIPLLRNTVVLPIRQIEWSYSFLQHFKKLLAQTSVDIIESSEIGSLFIASLASVPLVIRLHGNDFIFHKYSGQKPSTSQRANLLLEKKAMQRATALSSPSEFQAKEMASIANLPINKIKVIPNPVANALIDNENNSKLLMGTANQREIVFYCGRLAPVKGIEILLEAAEIIHELNPNVQFVLAGGWQMPQTPLEMGLEIQSEEKNTDGKIKWLGHLHPDAVMEWYRKSSIFVMPSFYETFGISVVEAMVFGVPVVATNVGGLTEIIADGKTGLLVPVGESQALAEAISRLIVDKSLAKKIGEAGKLHVMSNYAAGLVTNQTIKFYKQVIETN